MNLLPEDGIILKRLFASGDELIEPYEFHRVYSLSPGQIARTVHKLFDAKLIEQLEGKLRLTIDGKKWVTANKMAFYKINKIWKDIPAAYLGDRIEIDDVYLPEKINSITFIRRKR